MRNKISEFPPNTRFTSPSGWAGRIVCRSNDKIRYDVIFENGILDTYPEHLIKDPIDRFGNSIELLKPSHGGKRAGAGSKATGKPARSKVMRVPIELVADVARLIAAYKG